MPFVNIKVTGGAEAPTAEQKAELISGVTELLQRVLHKIPRLPWFLLKNSPRITGASAAKALPCAAANSSSHQISTAAARA